MRMRIPTLRRGPLATLALALLAGFGALAAEGLLGGAHAADGWDLAILASGLERPDNLAFVGDRLYLTEERPGGGGRVLLIEGGRTRTLVSGLDKPDGLLISGDALYISEETPNGRVLRFDLTRGRLTELARLRNPEGMGLLPDGSLVVAEDTRPGRLVRLPALGRPETLLAGLDRPEGLVVDGAGCIIYSETGEGRVSRWCEGAPRHLVTGLHHPDQLALCPDGSLWIGEDLDRGARLWQDRDGVARVVASGLRGVQGIECTAGGGVLVSEQLRGRLLLLTPGGPRRPRPAAPG